MNQALAILEELLAHLQEIQQALGDRWPDFARRMHELAGLFEGPLDEAALVEAINQLYGLFMEDEQAYEIVTRPGPDETTRLSPWPSMQNLSTGEIADCFYLLCRQADSLVQQLRLDVAAPDQVRPGESFELAVAVRLPISPVLTEDDLVRTKSGKVQVVWAESEPSVQLSVQVVAPACLIRGPDSFRFRLNAGQDSPLFYFTLLPEPVSEVGLVVTLYQEDVWLGSARVRIACGRVAGRWQVTQNPAANPDERMRWLGYRSHLRRMLDACFNESELRTLCFDLGVEYDNLSHATRADAARELIGYLERRDRLPELVTVGRQLRPDVSWDEIPSFGQANA